MCTLVGGLDIITMLLSHNFPVHYHMMSGLGENIVPNDSLQPGVPTV